MAIERAPTRRDVLSRLALGLGVVACGPALGQPAERAAYVGVETSASDGLSRASFFTGTGAPLGRVPLDFRAHGMAEHDQNLVVFPRRPGNRFAVIDRSTLEVRAVVSAPPDRHFFGHGAFTLDGRHLIVTENDLETLAGGLGVYRMDGTPERIGQIALPGPGPHEIARAPNRDRFLIAVGGLETHPDYGRTALNLHDFRSQVVSYDFESGTLDPMGHWPGSEGISLRHLAMDGVGRLFIGGQVKDSTRVGGDPVLWLVENGHERMIDVDGALGGYVSSVAAHGSRAAISSKESGRVLNFENGQLIAQQRLVGASALALAPGLSASAGFTLLALNGIETDCPDGFEFDNHGLALQG